MKRKFQLIAKRLGAAITSYKTWEEPGSGGLQVFDVNYMINGKAFNFGDSYYHLSGDAPKVLEMFEIEIKTKGGTK